MSDYWRQFSDPLHLSIRLRLSEYKYLNISGISRPLSCCTVFLRIPFKRDSEEYCTLYPTDNQAVLTLDQVMVALEVRLSGMMNLQVMLAVKPGVM